MAQGDVKSFFEARALMLETWSTSDVIKVAVCDNTTTPTQATATPNIADFTQVGTGGTYVSGGTSLGTWGDFVSQSTGTVTFDTATNPTWAADAGNDADAHWGIVYNATTGDAGWYVDLGGPVDMTANPLSITWNGAGLSTIGK